MCARRGERRRAALDVPPAGYAAFDRDALADMFAARIVQAREGLDGMTAARRNEEGLRTAAGRRLGGAQCGA